MLLLIFVVISSVRSSARPCSLAQCPTFTLFNEHAGDLSNWEPSRFSDPVIATVTTAKAVYQGLIRTGIPQRIASMGVGQGQLFGMANWSSPAVLGQRFAQDSHLATVGKADVVELSNAAAQGGSGMHSVRRSKRQRMTLAEVYEAGGAAFIDDAPLLANASAMALALDFAAGGTTAFMAPHAAALSAGRIPPGSSKGRRRTLLHYYPQDVFIVQLAGTSVVWLLHASHGSRLYAGSISGEGISTSPVDLFAPAGGQAEGSFPVARDLRSRGKLIRVGDKGAEVLYVPAFTWHSVSARGDEAAPHDHLRVALLFRGSLSSGAMWTTMLDAIAREAHGLVGGEHANATYRWDTAH